MSNARNLADVISGNYDVPAGSLDNVDLSSRVAKSGDTMTGDLIVDGNVGIGTSSPNRLLTVDGGSSDAYLKLNTTSTSGSFASGILFNNTTNPDGSIMVRVNANSNDLSFYTGNSERMRLDSAGRVTMPYQPRFNAYDGGDSFGGSIVVLDFTDVLHNNGGHYNTSNYRFTAPIAGTYRFSFSLMIYSERHSRCQFAKNGSVIGNQFYSSSYNNYSRNCGEIIIALSAGDYIEVKRNVQSESNEGVHANYRHFSGELIG